MINIALIPRKLF
jgi:hypothetical protein